jgi:hypothetical protein
VQAFSPLVNNAAAFECELSMAVQWKKNGGSATQYCMKVLSSNHFVVLTADRALGVAASEN